MPIMTNAEAFHYDFGIYATELWARESESVEQSVESVVSVEERRSK